MVAPYDMQETAERQSEYARSLALFLVAHEAKMSSEYLQKLCRNWEPRSSAINRPLEIPRTEEE